MSTNRGRGGCPSEQPRQGCRILNKKRVYATTRQRDRVQRHKYEIVIAIVITVAVLIAVDLESIHRIPPPSVLELVLTSVFVLCIFFVALLLYGRAFSWIILMFSRLFRGRYWAIHNPEEAVQRGVEVVFIGDNSPSEHALLVRPASNDDQGLLRPSASTYSTAESLLRPKE